MIDVEPTIQEELERLAPREDVRPNWSEVLRRKGGPFEFLALMPPDPSLN